MLGKLFLAFVLVPIFDLYLLVKIGGEIGTLNTVMLVLLTAFVGAALARSQGMAAMQKVRENMDQGIMPAEEILDAVIIFAAGLTLLTPGFITDTLGLLLLFPPTRGYFKRWLRIKMANWKKNPNVHMTYQHTEFKAWTNPEPRSHEIENVIDIEAHNPDDKDKPLQ